MGNRSRRLPLTLVLGVLLASLGGGTGFGSLETLHFRVNSSEKEATG